MPRGRCRRRQQLGIPVHGDLGAHHLINIHFTSPTLGQRLLLGPPGAPSGAQAAGGSNAAAMLYFVFNRDVVGVVVAHDLQRGEFVAQVRGCFQRLARRCGRRSRPRSPACPVARGRWKSCEGARFHAGGWCDGGGRRCPSSLRCSRCRTFPSSAAGSWWRRRRAWAWSSCPTFASCRWGDGAGLRSVPALASLQSCAPAAQCCAASRRCGRGS